MSISEAVRAAVRVALPLKPVRSVGDLVGLTMTEVRRGAKDHDTVVFHAEDGRRFRLLHLQDCCENVCLEDVAGDLQDLVGSPILLAEESASDVETDRGCSDTDLQRWTFYRFATAKGYVTLRWYGASNGYYSVSVDFVEMGGDA